MQIVLLSHLAIWADFTSLFWIFLGRWNLYCFKVGLVISRMDFAIWSTCPVMSWSSLFSKSSISCVKSCRTFLDGALSGLWPRILATIIFRCALCTMCLIAVEWLWSRGLSLLQGLLCMIQVPQLSSASRSVQSSVSLAKVLLGETLLYPGVRFPPEEDHDHCPHCYQGILDGSCVNAFPLTAVYHQFDCRLRLSDRILMFLSSHWFLCEVGQ